MKNETNENTMLLINLTVFSKEIKQRILVNTSDLMSYIGEISDYTYCLYKYNVRAK